MIGPLPYIGGKRRLAKTIIEQIPPHTTYVEPFAGGCQVFFHKEPSRVEVLNDLDDEIINFLRVCQVHPEELARTLAFAVASRRLHQLLKEQVPSTLTDVQRAGRFLYLQKNSFGGRRVRQTFRFGVMKSSSFKADRLPQLLAAVAARLRHVQLECGPYEDVLRRYDRPSTFFYLDPPYVGLKLYRYNLPDEEFDRMANTLATLRGRFLLSINDCELSRRMFSQFSIQRVPVAYTAARSVPVVHELLIANYSLPESVPSNTAA